MPFKLPDLDDRNYDDLVEEARASIPALYPQWTNHNPSDPGITLVELFAWMTDVVLYRTNQISTQTYEAFLRLLNGPTWQRPPGQELDTAIRDSVKALRERYRAVTSDDYEYLIRYPFRDFMAGYVWPAMTDDADKQEVARVRCLAEHDLDAPSTGVDVIAPGHVSVILVQASSHPIDLADQGDPIGQTPLPWAAPSAALLTAVKTFLNPRRLLTTRLHVVGPTYVPIQVKAKLYLREDAVAADVRAETTARIGRYFDPLTGGADGRGWPFGRNVHVSEVYALLDDVHGVDFAEGVALRLTGDMTELDVAPLLEHELPQAYATETSITLFEKRGNIWEQNL